MLAFVQHNEYSRCCYCRVLCTLDKKIGQTTESGIPKPFRATVRYSRMHLDFWPRSATLIGQLSLVPVFHTNPLRYIVPRLFSSAVTAF